jgi:hypothetical protein
MSRCVHHPGRESVLTVNQRGYCANCQTGIVAARNQVDRHVVPKDCFVWYVRANTWQAITGTGCAHWMAHQLGIRSTASQEQCLAGYICRVATLVQRTTAVPLANVRVNDIYVSPNTDHTGLVIRVTPSPPTPAGPGRPQIMIRHDSSRQGGVSDNEFATYFQGSGTFRRLQ